MAADAPRFAVTTEPLDAASLAGAVAAAARQQGLGPGAIVTFAGLVRAENAGRRVRFLEYEGYEPLAIRSFELIAAEAAEHWAGVALGVHHRLGRLDIGDTSIIIVAASAHRAEAYEACRYAIERVKQIVPVWKHEHFEGGDVWIEGATARPDDADAREQALRRACV
jgi:molybdopterin synthase catalytic subunit